MDDKEYLGDSVYVSNDGNTLRLTTENEGPDDPSNKIFAEFSKCRTYRYALWRKWDLDLDFVLFVGLNPSTADETEDDPTIRRCIRFARDWGYGGIYMCNIFAYRATKPNEMKAAAIDPVGPDNNWYLRAYQRLCPITIAAWGNHGTFRNRDCVVQRPEILGKPLHCLGTNKNGTPKHPLYLPATSKPKPYEVPA